MLSEIKRRDVQRNRRVMRVRKKVRGNAERPRMCIYKSNKHLFVQIIDDEQGKTLVSLGSMMPECKGANSKKSKESARFIGTMIAKKALDKNISQVVFDRGHYQYHGLIAILADAAREVGLKF